MFGGCLLEGRFTVKWYTVEVSEALSENCCKEDFTRVKWYAFGVSRTNVVCLHKESYIVVCGT